MIYFSALSVLLHTALLLTWPMLETTSRYTGQDGPITLSLEPLHSGIAQAGQTLDPTGQQTAPGVELFRNDKIVHPRISQQADKSFPESFKKHPPPELSQRDSSHTVSVKISKQPTSENLPETIHKAGEIARDNSRINDSALLALATSGAESHYQNIQGTSLPAGTSTVRSNILTSLSQAFAPYFRYPQLAQRRGWQGVVELGVHINANGQLGRIWINRSSGHRILDKAAAKSLDQVMTLPSVESDLNGSDLDMVLPVEYRLIEG